VKGFRYLCRVDRLRWARTLCILAVSAAALLAGATSALAAAGDARLIDSVNQAMVEDYPGNLGEAQRRVQAALDACRGRCSTPARAQALVALGMIASQLGQEDDAKSNFAAALQADPRAKLPANLQATPNIKQQWADAQAQAQAAAGGDTSGGEEQAPEQPVAPPAGKPPAGWTSREAFDLAYAAMRARESNDYAQCIENDQASLKIEEQPRTRLHLSSCEYRSSKYRDALRDARRALEIGIQKRDTGLIRVARPRVEELIKKMPRVTFVAPAGLSDLAVEFDDRKVTGNLAEKYSVDPGHHKVVARASGGEFEDEFDIKETELYTVRIKLAAPLGGGAGGQCGTAGSFLTKGQCECILKAKNEEDLRLCYERTGKRVVVRAGMDAAGYADTTHVYVFTPSINASITSPTAGWDVGGSYLLDVITAASPDIVSEASRSYKEKRNAGALHGGYKPGLYGVSAQANFSVEPDYTSLGGGIAGTADLDDKLLTPRVAFNYSHDTIGRGDTPFNVFHHSLNITNFEAGITRVLSPTSIIVLNATVDFERGDQSKPYRYVPMFDPAVAPLIPVGGTVDLVNRFREPMRPLEQLPTERDRYAAGVRFNHRFSGSTLRLEERLYYDTWSTKATTTDARYLIDVSKHLRVWPHGRLNLQTGTNFWALAYTGLTNPQTGAITVPTYRTTDRELSPLATVTAGGGARIALGAPEATVQYGVTIQGDVMYTRFFDAIFLTTRTAVYGSVGFDAEFE
jgi:tetratricopeptide (TPR) repeat protein